MELLHTLAQRDVLLQHHAVEGLGFDETEFYPSRTHTVVCGPITIVISINKVITFRRTVLAVKNKRIVFQTNYAGVGNCDSTFFR